MKYFLRTYCNCLTIFIIPLLMSCELHDNRIKGHLDQPNSEPSGIATGVSLDFSDCFASPPEALPYVCEPMAQAIYNQGQKASFFKLNSNSNSNNNLTSNLVSGDTKVNSSLAEDVTFELTNNTCDGISLNNSGMLEGLILKSASETCSFTLKVTYGGYTDTQSMTLTVAPSLIFSFSEENLLLTENQAASNIVLNLSSPAPYDTYVDFDIYGDQSEVIDGLSHSTKKILIKKGETAINLNVTVPSSSGIASSIYQQLKLTSGSATILPSISLTSIPLSIMSPVFSKLSAGAYHSCGIQNNELYCWGSNVRGQLGESTGATNNQSLPLRVGVSSNWSHIDNGDFFTCGIDNTNLYCWGEDSFGQVGNGAPSTSNILNPAQIAGTWSTVATGFSHACGITNGNLFCWGRDTYDQLGDGPGTTDSHDPVAIASGLASWSDISLGYSHSCGIESGSLYCWGRNYEGQVGKGSTSARENIPLKIGVSTAWTKIATGFQHSCGLQSGNLYCWGAGYTGQLGNDDSTANVTAPIQIGTSNAWTDLSLGGDHSCGINNQTLFCWGADSRGQLGNGETLQVTQETPQQVGELTSWQTVSAGTSHVCGSTLTQSYCWGEGSSGQAGNAGGAILYQHIPEIVGTSNSWTMVSTGQRSTCGLKGTQLLCWGSDSTGQVGNGQAARLNIITPSPIAITTSWEVVNASYRHACGISEGRLFCWGDNENGKLGSGGNLTEFVASPLQIGTSTSWTQISSLTYHTCGINSGQLFCWGKNADGQVGDASTAADVVTPYQVGVSTLWTQISAGGNHTCGVNNGELYCWGRNVDGQIGNNTSGTTDVLNPLKIGGSTSWTHIVLGASHSCGIDAGKLFCWGHNGFGQIGNGNANSTDITAPLQIGSLDTWTEISAGTYYNCGIHDGNLYCWGDDADGQLGINVGTGVESSPVQVGSLTGWLGITTGNNHSCAIRSGSLYCWGANDYGQIGKSSSILSSPFLLVETQ